MLMESTICVNIGMIENVCEGPLWNVPEFLQC